MEKTCEGTMGLETDTHTCQVNLQLREDGYTWAKDADGGDWYCVAKPKRKGRTFKPGDAFHSPFFPFMRSRPMVMVAASGGESEVCFIRDSRIVTVFFPVADIGAVTQKEIDRHLGKGTLTPVDGAKEAGQ